MEIEVTKGTEKETKFTCGYCGNAHATPNERGACEIACYAKEVEKAQKEKTEKLKQEKSKRIEEIEIALEGAKNLIVKYNADYKEPFPIKGKYYGVYDVIEEVLRRR